MPSRHRSSRRLARACRPLLGGVLLLAVGGCSIFSRSSGDLSQGELLLELSDTINELRSHDALLQEELDSLRAELARQDTVITRLAAAAGVAPR
jgi:uncharacterized small protein (DUF1192 family)